MNLSQQWNQPELNLEIPDQPVKTDFSSEKFIASYLSESPTGDIRLMESILERENMLKALKRVKANKGAPGIDKMTLGELDGFLRRHWVRIREELLNGTYKPYPVLRVEIPKPDRGIRELGIPTVLDRLIQQAMAQVLNKIWDYTFSDSSFGFRPGRSQHDAIFRAKKLIKDGGRFCVDMDLSKFFDRVNHDRLMSRLTIRIKDKRVLKLIRAYLNAGVMIGDTFVQNEEGTPQGGPLSPLLSNIVLDELDKELEKRKLHFVRYADDFVIYVKSKRAGERVMKSVSKFVVKKLRLKVNEEKSAVGRPWQRKFLGFSFTNSKKDPKISIHWKSIKRFKDRLRERTKRNCGRSVKQVINETMKYINGWWNYYGICESTNRLKGIAEWIRRRLRSLTWVHWKNRRTRVRELMKRGISKKYAVPTGCSRRGPWRMSKVKWVVIALPNRIFHSLGLIFPWMKEQI
jgi:RNA-directed DNA polymerase